MQEKLTLATKKRTWSKRVQWLHQFKFKQRWQDSIIWNLRSHPYLVIQDLGLIHPLAVSMCIHAIHIHVTLLFVHFLMNLYVPRYWSTETWGWQSRAEDEWALPFFATAQSRTGPAQALDFGRPRRVWSPGGENEGRQGRAAVPLTGSWVLLAAGVRVWTWPSLDSPHLPSPPLQRSRCPDNQPGTETVNKGSRSTSAAHIYITQADEESRSSSELCLGACKFWFL